MKEVVIGIDLGTSAVKIIMMNKNGDIVGQTIKAYELIELQDGYVEQNPDDWVKQTIEGLHELLQKDENIKVEGISFSGQMHGLVMLDKRLKPIRNAILWNDTRTTKQCRELEELLGESLYSITKNDALEGFTLPKLLWIKEHEPLNYEQLHVFVLPKDYLRLQLTGSLHMEYSDAAGTLLLNMDTLEWSKEICERIGLSITICPPLIESNALAGFLLPQYREIFRQDKEIPVYAGGADNACGALGAGIVDSSAALISIGTSGVVLTLGTKLSYAGNFIHSFAHVKKDAHYMMGVTLAAGESLRWYRENFAAQQSFDELLDEMKQVPIGSSGLLFTPYLFGERTPYGDSTVRASFIGMKNTHTKAHFTRAVVEGVTFSLKQCFDLVMQHRAEIQHIVCIGGAAKNEHWLQIIADIFGMPIYTLAKEQGPALGAAMLASVGIKWVASYNEAASNYVKKTKVYNPNIENHELYMKYFECYKMVYEQTKILNEMQKRVEFTE
ncbi:xylulokinase [Metasolibacillus fluoroglycofenilyticus]|uniref:xylulokinase n=1 Tax=Metasolibacillus fluoroglycofenilyticus TaxID=1239396 RepID=UPI000D3A1582|nr:xylulokinase [Metasolibacillus fluoroglycofenilyticus]